jgi:AraC-like DNA-binding protein
MAEQATMAGVAVLDLLKALQRAGLGPALLCRAAGLSIASLEESDARVPTRLVTRLLDHAEERARDPLIGIHAGERSEPRGPLIYLVLSSARFAEGLRQAERFSVVGLDTLRFTIRTERDVVSVGFDVADSVFSRSRHAMEYLLMMSVSGLRYALGAGFRVREVNFRHRGVGDKTDVERAFGCPVHFGARWDRLILPQAALAITPRLANRSLAREIGKFAEALSARVARDAGIRDRVHHAMRALLAEGLRPDSDSVGRKLAMSSRTLQRKLAEDGTNFRSERDSVACQTAEALLSNPSLKIEAIARSVGFSELAAFSKAFRRWKGYSPTHHRAAMVARSTRTPREVA